MPGYNPSQMLEIEAIQSEEINNEVNEGELHTVELEQEVAHVAPLRAAAIPGEAAHRIGRIGAGVAQSLIRSSALFNSEPGSVFASGSDQQRELMTNLGM